MNKLPWKLLKNIDELSTNGRKLLINVVRKNKTTGIVYIIFYNEIFKEFQHAWGSNKVEWSFWYEYADIYFYDGNLEEI